MQILRKVNIILVQCPVDNDTALARQERLHAIVGFCKLRRYTKAADEYLLLSIGKAV